jgi:hypothetical protein
MPRRDLKAAEKAAREATGCVRSCRALKGTMHEPLAPFVIRDDVVASPQARWSVPRAWEALKSQLAEKRPLLGELQPTSLTYRTGNGLRSRGTLLRSLPILARATHWLLHLHSALMIMFATSSVKWTGYVFPCSVSRMPSALRVLNGAR